MRRGRHAGRAGFALLPVVLALALLGATAYLMTRESASGVALVASAQQTDRARYVAEAALRHVTWQAHTASCDGYSDVATTAFGADSYSATVTPTSGSPITVAATGTLADGTTYTFTRAGEPVYETPTSVVLQLSSPDGGKDTILDSFYAARNCGGTSYLQVNPKPDWTQRVLIQFDLSSLPAGVEVISARLELKQWSVVAPGVVSVHRLTRDWVEGTKVCGGTADGANWPTFDGIDAWAVPGGDFDLTPASEARVTNATNDQWMGWEVGSLVEGWLADPASNHGMLLQGEDVLREAKFASREASNPLDAPKLTVTYACECGQVCEAGAGAKRVLYVVEDPANLSAEESARRTLMGSWGFAVTLIDDDADEKKFYTEAAVNDAAYVSQEAIAATLGSMLSDSVIGVVNESKDMIDDFGFAKGLSMGGGVPTLNVDPDHYITSVFESSPVAPYVASEWYQIPAEPVAAGVDPVGTWVEAPWMGKPALLALPEGADLIDGGSAAGRRVQIPWGSGQGAAPVALDSLSDDARTIIERSIEWAAGAGCDSVKRLLLLVGDASNPAPQETARQTLMESWCFAVELLTAAEPVGQYNLLAPGFDVVYVPSTVPYADVTSKLKLLPVGVVNEVSALTAYLGFTSGSGGFSGTQTEIVDNAHAITSPFSTGALTITSSSQSLHRFVNTIGPGFHTLSTTTWSEDPMLMTLDEGDELVFGGKAPDRRVMLPWGSSSFDFMALNADGQTLMRRAIEWAAAPGCDSLKPLLLVVSDADDPTLQEAARQTLLESWCYAVTRIDDDAASVEFAAAMVLNDVIYISPEITTLTGVTKLQEATIGIVNEDPGLHPVFGFSSIRYQGTTNAPLNTDGTHYITSPFAGGEVTLFTSDQPCGAAVGTLPSGLETIGTWSSGALSPLGGLLTLETGAAISGGGTAAGRRVQLPWDGVDGVSVADIDALTADGRTILQRALEWAAGAGGGGVGGVVFEEFTEGREAIGVSAGFSIPKPSGTSVGDLLIAAVATDGNTASTLSPSASWNLTQIDVGDNGGGDVTFGVWWKIADGTEPSTLIYSWTGGEQAYGWIMRFTGHDPSSPIGTAATSTGNDGDPLSTNLITSTDGNLILRLGGFDDDDITLDVPGLPGHTAIAMDRSNAGNLNTVSGGAGYVIQPTAGDTGTSNFDLTAKEQYRTVTLAIRPAP